MNSLTCVQQPQVDVLDLEILEITGDNVIDLKCLQSKGDNSSKHQSRVVNFVTCGCLVQVTANRGLIVHDREVDSNREVDSLFVCAGVVFDIVCQHFFCNIFSEKPPQHFTLQQE